MFTPDERESWLSNWVDLLHEFASPSLQQRVWVQAAVPDYMSSHTELMCCYFDDLNLSGSRNEGDLDAGYRWATEEGLVTAKEAAAVARFHHAAAGYSADYDTDDAYGRDSAWLAVASLAAEAWHHLRSVARKEVLDLMREREAQFGEVVRGRDWESRGEWLDADFTVLTAAQRGRTHGLPSRSAWDIGNEGTLNDAAVEVGGGVLGPARGERLIEPGESAPVRLHPLAPEFWYRVQVGQMITMREGSRVVGHATIRRVELPPPF